MNDLHPEKKLVDLHIFDGASVCRKALKILKAMVSCIVGAEHTFRDVFEGCECIDKINKLCRED